MHRVARRIYQTIKDANHIILIPHQNPDGDALGSVNAFAEWLFHLKKSHRIFCATTAAPRFHYLPHAHALSTDPDIWKRPIDCVVVFDSGDLRYAGVAEHIANLPQKPTIINIDHHATNEHYGDLNMVIVGASSTAEVLHQFFTINAIPIQPRMATSLLTGLMTDTDNFTNAATSPSALQAAGALLKRGGNLPLIRGLNFKDKSVNSLKVWGLVLARLQKHEALDIVHTYLMRDDLATHQVNESESEGIANFLNNLRDGRASLILKQLPDNQWKGSFRTTRNDVDVSRFAKALSGGGHKKAAGFVVKGTHAEALEHIFSTIHHLEAAISSTPATEPRSTP